MDDLFSLSGKRVVLTGGCGNLGKVMARRLLQYGAQLFVADIAPALPDELRSCDGSDRLVYLNCDLSSAQAVREAFADVKHKYGIIDVLVNNAAYGGGAGGKKAPVGIAGTDEDVWALGMDGTVGVTFRCMREALPYMADGGSIVNIASMYGVVAPDPSIYGDTGNNSPVMYGVGKAGIIQLTRYCASHLAPRGIRVNSITPGPFPNVTPAMDKDFYARLKGKTMMNRTGDPDELSGALLLLASGASSFMTGANIVVDGGWTAW